MADTKISALSAGTAAPGDEIPVNRSGSNFKITAGDILKINGGTITADSPVLNLTQTWNNAAVTFTGLKFNVPTDTSASGSLLMDLQVAGVSTFKVTKGGDFGGAVTLKSYATYLAVTYAGTERGIFGVDDGAAMFKLPGTGFFGWAPSTTLTTTYDLALFRDAAGTLAQRNGTNAQTFRIYNTYTDASNYERGKIAWDTNVLKIGTEKAGTGTARALELQTDGTTRLTISAAGEVSATGTFTHTATGGEVFTISGTNGAVTCGRFLQIAQTQSLIWQGRSRIGSPADGNLVLWNNAANDFGLLQFGGGASSFPALKRSSTTLQARLADDSDYGSLQGKLTTETAYTAGAPTATGYIVLYDSTGTAYKVPAEAL